METRFYSKEIFLKFRNFALVFMSFFLASCSLWRSTGESPPGAPTEYVEVSNPMQTASSSSPATIWVPAKAESGIPRGSVLLQEGIDELRGKGSGKEASPTTATAAPPTGTTPAPPGSAAVTAPTAAPARGATPVPRSAPAPVVLPAPVPVQVKKRIAIIESGNNGLLTPFSDQVRLQGIGVPLDLSSKGVTATVATNENERPAYAGALWKDNVAAVLVVVSAPDGVAGGQPLAAEIYDGLESSRLRRVTTVIPTPVGDDRVSRDVSLATALADLAFRVGDVVNLTPWYGKIFALEGERVYVNAGRESGIQVGQKLKVFRGGKMFPGIGFDPGTQVAIIEIAGFVGTNGSYGIAKDGQNVQLTDIVSFN